MDFSDYVDDNVVLYGIADNASAGAVLRCGPSSHVYIGGLSRWSDSERYKPFQVTGTLIKRSGDIDLHAADGTVAHGIGAHYVVQKATWKPISS